MQEYKNSFLFKNKLLFYRYLFNVNKDILYWVLFLLYKKKTNVLIKVTEVLKREEVFFITRLFIFIIVKILKK